MINLSEFRIRPNCLADYLPWACLVAPGIVLNKDGSYQRTAQFRGPDLDSTTEEGLVAVCARINNALKRFGSGWGLYFEASRLPAQNYPHSNWRDQVAWLVDTERYGHFAETGDLYESAYYLTFGFLPPADRVGKFEDVLIETPQDIEELAGRDHLARFIAETDKALDLFANVLVCINMMLPE